MSEDVFIDMLEDDPSECLRQTPETDAFYAKLYSPNVPASMIEIACGDERSKMQSFERERDEAREENARLREALGKSKEFVQSWGELIDTQYPLWNECMTTIQKALTP